MHFKQKSAPPHNPTTTTTPLHFCCLQLFLWPRDLVSSFVNCNDSSGRGSDRGSGSGSSSGAEVLGGRRQRWSRLRRFKWIAVSVFCFPSLFLLLLLLFFYIFSFFCIFFLHKQRICDWMMKKNPIGTIKSSKSTTHDANCIEKWQRKIKMHFLRRFFSLLQLKFQSGISQQLAYNWGGCGGADRDMKTKGCCWRQKKKQRKRLSKKTKVNYFRAC